jgi:hypothetical protein
VPALAMARAGSPCTWVSRLSYIVRSHRPCAVRHLVAGSAAPALAGSAARAEACQDGQRGRASHRACRSTNVGPSPLNGRHAAEADRHQNRYEVLAHVVSNDAGRFPVLCSVRVPRIAKKALPPAGAGQVRDRLNQVPGSATVAVMNSPCHERNDGDITARRTGLRRR